MAAKVTIEVTTLPSGAASVGYTAGRYFGAVMFDPNGRYIDATMQTVSSMRGRGFVNHPDDLPAGVYKAARAALTADHIVAEG